MRKLLETLLIAFSLTAGACGGSEGGKDLEKFIGVWSPTSGTYNQLCPTDDNNTFSAQVNTSDTWTKGATSDLVQSSPDDSFVLHADVSADTASASPTGQTYSLNGTTSTGGPVTQTFTFTAYTFVISPDGLTASENFSQTLVMNFSAQGIVDNCTITQAASYTKQ
jgi:hypothetical protein